MALPQNHIMKTIISAAFLLLFALGFVSPLQAQDQDGQSALRGFQPNGSYALSDIESVSLSGGNLKITRCPWRRFLRVVAAD